MITPISLAGGAGGLSLGDDGDTKSGESFLENGGFNLGSKTYNFGSNPYIKSNDLILYAFLAFAGYYIYKKV